MGIFRRPFDHAVHTSRKRLIPSKAPAGDLDQEGFRFRNDDGSESAATWMADQDTNVMLAADTTARLRVLINTSLDPGSKNYQLEYRYKPSGGAFGSWTKVN
jgi:hypothetical protein